MFCWLTNWASSAAFWLIRALTCCCKARTASSIVIESIRTPEPRGSGSRDLSQFVDFLRQDQQPRENLRLRNDSSNEFLTRSNVNQQRVSHSFWRAPRSFQIRSPTSLTLVPTSFALAPDSQLTVAINKGQATQRAQRAPQQGGRGKELNGAPATILAVFLLCVQRDYLCLTPAMGCAHMDDHHACRVTTIPMIGTAWNGTSGSPTSNHAWFG